VIAQQRKVEQRRYSIFCFRSNWKLLHARQQNDISVNHHGNFLYHFKLPINYLSVGNNFQLNLYAAVQTCFKLNMSVLMADDNSKVSSMMKAVSGRERISNCGHS
jgi:hypothetical protein